MLNASIRRQLRGLPLLVLVASLLAVPAIADDIAVVFGTDSGETVNGTPASEAIYARAGNDVVNAAGGDDEIDGGEGADAINGGDGSDVVSYTTTAAVTVTLDGVADDGAVGEGDNVGPDVEDVIAGDAADKLVGSPAENTLDGGGGDDRIDGHGGSDVLLGGAGDDTINARDGVADRVDCGDGSDTAVLDRVDATVNCERKAIPALTPSFADAMFGSSRVTSLRLGVSAGSDVVIACVSGCRPRSSAARTLVRRNSVKTRGGIVTIRLPGSPQVIAGATIEVGVTAPRAQTRCVVIRMARKLPGHRRLDRECRSVAKGS